MMTWAVLKTAIDQWLCHRTARLGAALAYYSVFSMGPLLLIVTSIAGLFFGEDAARGSLSSEFRSLLGPTGSQAIEAMLAGASSLQSGRRTAVLGFVLLVIAALGVVVALKDALNTIWNVAEPKSAGVWWYARTYLISLAGIIGLGFLLMVSLVANAGLAAVFDRLGFVSSSIGMATDLVGSLAILSLLFAMLFKWFPDTEVAWRDVVWGGILTAILFNVGKFAIGWYIGTLGLQSTYGAATSLVILLIWVYYSAQIVLFGAELTHAYAVQVGSRRAADANAGAPQHH